MKEAVLFALVKNGKLLIEIRPGNEYFIPNGSIEKEDRKFSDYKVAGMKREALEELGIEITKYEHLMDYEVKEIGIIFYCYIVIDWNGVIPEYSIEDGKKFADLKWIEIRDYKNVFTLPSALAVCEKILSRN